MENSKRFSRLEKYKARDSHNAHKRRGHRSSSSGSQKHTHKHKRLSRTRSRNVQESQRQSRKSVSRSHLPLQEKIQLKKKSPSPHHQRRHFFKREKWPSSPSEESQSSSSVSPDGVHKLSEKTENPGGSGLQMQLTTDSEQPSVSNLEDPQSKNVAALGESDDDDDDYGAPSSVGRAQQESACENQANSEVMPESINISRNLSPLPILDPLIQTQLVSIDETPVAAIPFLDELTSRFRRNRAQILASCLFEPEMDVPLEENGLDLSGEMNGDHYKDLPFCRRDRPGSPNSNPAKECVTREYEKYFDEMLENSNKKEWDYSCFHHVFTKNGSPIYLSD